MLTNVRKVSRAIRLRFSVRASRPSSRVIGQPPVCLCLDQSLCRARPGGVTAVFRPGAWFPSDTRRCAEATWVLLLAASAGAGTPAPAPPDAADVVRAYQAARQWVDDFKVPDPEEPAARVPIAGSHGVCLVLRQAGRVIATGTDASGDDLMLRRATARALGEVLADPAVAALPREMVTSSGSGLLVELEVAGHLSPLLGGSEEEI